MFATGGRCLYYSGNSVIPLDDCCKFYVVGTIVLRMRGKTQVLCGWSCDLSQAELEMPGGARFGKWGVGTRENVKNGGRKVKSERRRATCHVLTFWDFKLFCLYLVPRWPR